VVGEAGARLRRPVLVVVNADDAVTQKSLRNIPQVRVLVSGQLNTYDVLAADHVVFTQAALAEFVARTGGELVTVDKPVKTAKAAKPKADAEAAEAAGDGGGAKAKPARAAKPKADAEAAEAAGDGGGAEAKPAKPAASRARKPATAKAKEEQE
jgi:large subunit ribosomal protein L4